MLEREKDEELLQRMDTLLSGVDIEELHIFRIYNQIKLYKRLRDSVPYMHYVTALPIYNKQVREQFGHVVEKIKLEYNLNDGWINYSHQDFRINPNALYADEETRRKYKKMQVVEINKESIFVLKVIDYIEDATEENMKELLKMYQSNNLESMNNSLPIHVLRIGGRRIFSNPILHDLMKDIQAVTRNRLSL